MIDTNVLSESRRPKPNGGVIAWLSAADEYTLFVSVLTMGELRKGIALVTEPARQARLEAFFTHLRARFGGRILSVDEWVAERWGRLSGMLLRSGIKIPVTDGLLAATALHHDLTVVTRNEADFKNAGVSVLNPFS